MPITYTEILTVDYIMFGGPFRGMSLGFPRDLGASYKSSLHAVKAGPITCRA